MRDFVCTGNEVLAPPKQGEVFMVYVGASRVCTGLGGQPRAALDESLSETIENFVAVPERAQRFSWQRL